MMFVLRWNFLAQHNIASDDIATPEKLTAVCTDRVNNPANNFKNLFELPVLFYVVSGIAFCLQVIDISFLTGAWLFVAFRITHSVIQCTCNHVDARFYVYQVASMALWFLVIKVTIAMIIPFM
jgi:hypothetical protein